MRALLAGALLFVVALLLDKWGWDTLRRDGVYDTDWGRLFRIIGYWPTWLAGGIAVALYDRGLTPPPPPCRWRRGLLLAAAPFAAGFLSEALKLVLRRERPGAHDGAHVFRAFGDQTWSTKGLGLPSGHAITSFAAAAMLSYMFPRTWPVWWFLAVANSYTRVAAGAHFLSDVVLAAFLGWLVSWFLWTRLGPRPAATPDVPRGSFPPVPDTMS